MIAATSRSDQPQTIERPARALRWQQLLNEAVRDPQELCRMLDLDPAILMGSNAAHQQFPLRVPRSFVAKMRRGDPRDPLLLQVLPLAKESEVVEGFGRDPVGDLDSRTGQGVLHKYHGRALLVATGACAVHCRYCFRRHFPYAEQSALADGWHDALMRIRIDPSIDEVILSGGDPLSLSDRRLKQLTDELQTLSHVRRLRIHTRYPIVLPERIDSDFIAWLEGVELQKLVVIHANHARELDRDTRDACTNLRAAGATVLNQSVLLAGVNDDVDSLADLSEALFDCRVLPYYLHVLDRVDGAAHFDVSDSRAVALHTELAARLPGYLVPKLVREIAGQPSKTPVTRGRDVTPRCEELR